MIKTLLLAACLMASPATYNNGELADVDGNTYVVDFPVTAAECIAVYDTAGTATREDDTPLAIITESGSGYTINFSSGESYTITF